MAATAEIIKAFASLAWPLLVLFLLWKFSGAISAVLNSAARRKFSLKVGSNELTMDEYSEQQIKLLGDLQGKLNELEAKLVASAGAGSAGGVSLESTTSGNSAVEEGPTGNGRILWVDDNPRNISYLIAVVEEQGSRVDTALSTDEAMRKFAKGRYDAVVSDMGRPEGDRAGIDLADRVRAADPGVPVLIFCGSWAAQNLREEALAHGVNEITASGAKLLAALGRAGVV